MRRIIAAIVVITLVLAGLIALRVRSQAAALLSASGGAGDIEGTEVDLSSRLVARIAAVHVKKGERVEAGALLVSLECSEPQAMLAEAEARLASQRAQAVALSTTAEASKRSHVAALATEIASKAQVAAVAEQRDAARRTAARIEALAGDVAESRVDEARSGATRLVHQVEAAEAQARAGGEQARAAAVAIRAATAQAEAAVSAVRAAEAAVERARLLVVECEVRAPIAAEVAELPFEAGELVTLGAKLVRLVDITRVRATFYLPNAEIGAVRPGARARVVADAYPEESFEGLVSTVALEAEFTPRNIQTRTDRDRLVYPVEVVIDNPQHKLRAGMPVQVTLPGTER